MKHYLNFVSWTQLAPTTSTSLVKSMQMIKNPVKTCDKVYSLIQNLTLQIRQRMEDPKSAGEDAVRLVGESLAHPPL